MCVVVPQPQPTTHNPEAAWQTNRLIKKAPFFEITSKRRKGFPSETRVKRGLRVVHGDKELHEKLGRNDPCPCVRDSEQSRLGHTSGKTLEVYSSTGFHFIEHRC
jgi:hypothetical protein